MLAPHIEGFRGCNKELISLVGELLKPYEGKVFKDAEMLVEILAVYNDYVPGTDLGCWEVQAVELL